MRIAGPKSLLAGLDGVHLRIWRPPAGNAPQLRFPWRKGVSGVRSKRRKYVVRITCDPSERAVVPEVRRIDMLDAGKVFAGPTGTWLGDRFDYDDARWLTAKFLAGRAVLLAWTRRGPFRRVISMRHRHARDVRKFRRRFPEAFGEVTRSRSAGSNR